MDIRDLLLPEYKENFPQELLPAFLRYVSELAGGLHDYYDSEMFEDDFEVWNDFDLTLHRNILEMLPEEVMQMKDFDAYETFGECEVLSYKMIKWLEANVSAYSSLPLKLLSIINLAVIRKEDSIVVKVDEKNECLAISYDPQATDRFTWPEELQALY